MSATHILIMLLACNGAPLLLEWLLRPHRSKAIDLGRTLADGRPLLGDSKTWVGACAMLLSGLFFAWLFALGWEFGLAFGALVALGDLLSSFIKRRLGLSPGSGKNGLDQLPESALPTLYAVIVLDLPWTYAVVVPIAFWFAQKLLSKLLYRLGIRRQPH